MIFDFQKSFDFDQPVYRPTSFIDMHSFSVSFFQQSGLFCIGLVVVNWNVIVLFLCNVFLILFFSWSTFRSLSHLLLIQLNSIKFYMWHFTLLFIVTDQVNLERSQVPNYTHWLIRHTKPCSWKDWYQSVFIRFSSIQFWILCNFDTLEKSVSQSTQWYCVRANWLHFWNKFLGSVLNCALQLLQSLAC